MISKVFMRTLRYLSTIRPPPPLPRIYVNGFSTTKIIKPAYSIQSEFYQRDEEQQLQIKFEQFALDYPFRDIPIRIIRNPSKYNLPQKQLFYLIALKAIKAKPNDVIMAAKILLPNRENYSEFNESYGGEVLFNSYLQPLKKDIVASINSPQSTVNQKLIGLNILSNLSSKNIREPAQNIDVRLLNKADESGILIAYYLQILVRAQLEYTHLLQHILAQLQSQEISKIVKLKIAKAIFSTPYYETHFSQKLLAQAMKAVTQNIQQMHSREIYHIIRLIYNFKTPESIIFCQKLQLMLLNKYSDEKNAQFHVPLILKLTKFSTKLGISSKSLIDFISNNMKKFQTIFSKQKQSKGFFFSLLFERQNQEISPDLIEKLKQYFFEGLKDFSEKDQADQGQLLRYNKLLSKYFYHFSSEQQQYIRNQYINKIIPYYSGSNQVLFYSMLVFFRIEIPQSPLKEEQIQKIRKYIQMFFQRTCKKNKSGQLHAISHINSVIQILYQILRHNISFNKKQLPQICQYDFSQKDTVEPQVLNSFFYYLLKTEHESKEEIRKALNSFQPIFQHYIRKNCISSFKTIFTILSVCDKVSFEHNFFYVMLENSMFYCLIKNPKFVIFQKDLRFINQKFIKRGYGSIKIKDFIVRSLQRPKDYQKFRNEYIEHHKRNLQRIARKKQEKRRE